MLSDEQTPSADEMATWIQHLQAMGGEANMRFAVALRELLTRRAQDEVVSKVVEWAASRPCDKAKSMSVMRRLKVMGLNTCGSCPPCLARTL